MKHSTITLAHGNGGRLMRELIEDVIVDSLQCAALDVQVDAASVEFDASKIIMTTDSFTVQPLEFPGGSIGTLAVHGTVNDLAVAGASPEYLSLNVIVEEGFDISRFRQLMEDVGRSAREASVAVVTGDTKVVPRGLAGGLYLVTTGIGYPLRAENLPPLSHLSIKTGDLVLVSGPIGDHGTAVLLAREEFGLAGELKSDCASVLPLIKPIVDLPGVKFLRDPTRGGLATVANELVRTTERDVILYEDKVPIAPEVKSVCEMLGFDPYYLACEGRVVAVTDIDSAGAVLEHWHSHSLGATAAIIGEIGSPITKHPLVRLKTRIGGERVLDELENDPLPRIC